MGERGEGEVGEGEVGEGEVGEGEVGEGEGKESQREGRGREPVSGVSSLGGRIKGGPVGVFSVVSPLMMLLSKKIDGTK